MSKIARKLSRKEKFDIATMGYFIPTRARARIYPNDKIKMADLSSKGKGPVKETKGFVLLKWGKTYRDEQITSYKRDIRAGLFTKSELLESMPPRFREWLWQKIKDVPYDDDAYEIDGYEHTQYGLMPNYVISGRGTRPLLVEMYQKDRG